LHGPTNDYDLFVINQAGDAVVAQSTFMQTGAQEQEPGELISSQIAAGQMILIVSKPGAVPRFMHLELYRGRLSVTTAGTARGHNTAAAACCVAAVDIKTSFPGHFEGGSKNPVEIFSSDGPRRIFYQADGTPITPGNFTSSGGMVLQKPDITAADGGATSLQKFRPFFGTSAAAPTAAAIAALLWSYNPSFTPAEIMRILTSTALDIESPGVDEEAKRVIEARFAQKQKEEEAEKPMGRRRKKKTLKGKEQYNFTDSESRIMKTHNGFEQAEHEGGPSLVRPA
jgi:subtilisin family serine protease